MSLFYTPQIKLTSNLGGYFINAISAKAATYKAVLLGCTVGSRQAEHESHRESMEEDDMVKSRQ